MKFLSVSLCLLLLTSSCQAGYWTDLIDQLYDGIIGIFKPYEEAPYTVVRHSNGYEERNYIGKKWVCTEMHGESEGDHTEAMFWKLFSYIDGNNDLRTKIPMTVPVTTEVIINSATDKKYTMCFYIDAGHQSTPPNPTDDAVFIQEIPAMNVLTRTVGGYMRNEAGWMMEAGNLAAIIQENGESVSLSHMYWVGYDAPFKFWSRRNEVWFPKN